MTQQSEQGRITESKHVLYLDPAELMRDNPAALIVHKDTYNRMSARFDPYLFQPPHVAKVKTFSSEHGEIDRYLVIDGMTRTKYVNDNYPSVMRDSPTFRFRVQDVTSSYLLNRLIVQPEERTEGQQSLTMLQYLRAVVPPTIEHSQIASDRIAAHLINGWENMVGEDLARKYSALAAFSFLGNQAINIATEDGLGRDITKQSKLMSEETSQEREQLQHALMEMGAVIRQTRLIRQEVARSAFVLVSGESPVIGGEREARRQIYGLLHMPEVENKLKSASPNIGEREQMRDQLGQLISNAFKNTSNAPNKGEIVTILSDALKDPNLMLDHTLDVFTAPNPVERYDRIREEINKDKLTKTYMSSHRLQGLGVVETGLINRLGSKINLPDRDRQGLISVINAGEIASQQAASLMSRITGEREQLIARGVRAQLLDEALSQIQDAQKAVVESQSLQTLDAKNKELANKINDVSRRINGQIAYQRVGTMIDQETGDRLKEGYGPQIKIDIIGLILGEFHTVNNENREQVEQRIKDYTGLDQDLLVKVKGMDISLRTALQIQTDRNRPVSLRPPVNPIPPPTLAPPVGPSGIPPEDPTSVFPGSGLPIQPTPPEEGVIVDIGTREEIRKQNNREKLDLLLDDEIIELNEIDLDASDITDALRQKIDIVVRWFGQRGYNHPNIPHLVQDTHPHLLEENRRLAEELVRIKRELSDRDTGTGR